jgi:hypothetical protein
VEQEHERGSFNFVREANLQLVGQLRSSALPSYDAIRRAVQREPDGRAGPMLATLRIGRGTLGGGP